MVSALLVLCEGNHCDENTNIFYPRSVLAFGYCRCLRLSVRVSVCQSRACPRDNSPLVQASITKFGVHMQKTLVKNPIVLGVIDLDLQGQFQLRSLNLSHLELVCMITCHQFKLESPYVDQKCILIQLRLLLILGFINPQLHFHFALWYVITYPCRGFGDAFSWTVVTLRHGWVIPTHRMWSVIIHTLPYVR